MGRNGPYGLFFCGWKLGGSSGTKRSPQVLWQDCLNAIANVLPEFMGGSADLAPSNMTLWLGEAKSLVNQFVQKCFSDPVELG